MIDNDTKIRVKDLWPDKWEAIINKYQKMVDDVDTNFDDEAKRLTIKKNILKVLYSRITGREYVLEHEQEVLKQIIPKDKLKDGVTYIGTGCSLSRHVSEARWDEKEMMFKYERSKYGHTFEDTMDHFADVIDNGIAGFTPLKEK